MRQYDYYGVVRKNRPFYWFNGECWCRTRVSLEEWVRISPESLGGLLTVGSGTFCQVSKLEVLVNCGSVPRCRKLFRRLV